MATSGGSGCGKKDDGCGCSIGGAPRTATSGAWVLLLAGAGFLATRRRRRA
jgi:MYXO-CTERM domain-containing protein